MRTSFILYMLFLSPLFRLTDFGRELLTSFCDHCSQFSEVTGVSISYFEEDSLTCLRIRNIPVPSGKRMKIHGKSVRVECSQGDTPFFKNRGKPASQPFLDDVHEWVIVMDKQHNLNPYMTESNIGEDPIEDIVACFASRGYTRFGSEWMQKRIFPFWGVTTPVSFPAGEEYIRSLVKERFSGHAGIDSIQERFPIVATLIVDENGTARIDSFARLTNDGILDRIAEDVCHEICRNKFIPATYRGHPVKSGYTIRFRREDMQAGVKWK